MYPLSITTSLITLTSIVCRYYKQKALVSKVIDQYVGEVRTLEDGEPTGATIRLDQEDLETVIPKLNCPLLVLNGRGRGCKALLIRINEADYNVDIKVALLLVIVKSW